MKPWHATLATIGVALLLALGAAWGQERDRRRPPGEGGWTSRRPRIPTGFGRLAAVLPETGGDFYSLWFEAADGTIRFLNFNPKNGALDKPIVIGRE